MKPWVILILVVCWIASLAEVGSWQNDAGHTAERVIWQAKESLELTAANQKIIKLENKARADEQKFTQDQAAISAQFQQDNKNEKRKTDAVIAALRDGTYRLRDPNATTSHPSGCTGSQTTTATSGRDGETGSELSAALSEALFLLVDDADTVARQLTSCQQTLLSDRSNQ